MLDENEEDICKEYYSENINMSGLCMYICMRIVWNIYIWMDGRSEGAVDDNGDIF